MPLTLREKMIASLLPVAVGIGLIGIGIGDRSPAPMVPTVYLSPEPERYPDCGDAESAPCVTWDDGDQGEGWYLVTGDSVTLLPVRPVASYEPATGIFWYELGGTA